MKYIAIIIYLILPKATFAFQKSDSTFIESTIVLTTQTGNIFGTLTLPNSQQKMPVTLIIAGSGPTDRNCNNPQMKNDAYKKLAHKLAINNIASVRFDKRGVGQSAPAGKSEADLRFEDYVNDAKDWLRLLKKDSRFGKVSIIGHSEGSLIGMIAASEADQFISLAGAGKPAHKILKDQLQAQSNEAIALCSPIIDSLTKGKLVAHINPLVASLFRASVQPYLISWFRYDPQNEIQKLTIPILLVQGSNDIQIGEEDAKLLNQANQKSKLVILEDMNHIFRTVHGNKMDNIATYNNAVLPLANGFVEVISNFILED